MGRKPKTPTTTLRCLCCGKEYDIDIFYGSNSVQYKAIGKIPYCRNCLVDIYNDYKQQFIKEGFSNPDKKAIQRFCMAFDFYYNENIYIKAADYMQKISDKFENNLKKDLSFLVFYIQQSRLVQYANKNYISTIINQYSEYKENLESFNMVNNDIKEENADVKNVIIQKASKFFGAGFEDDDYIFLQEQYEDWITRHECQTKSQEEMFKQICFTQLSIWKAERARMDTKDLQATFLKQLEAAKLQPKQNKSDTVSEAQTFGTLIDKWENTKPIPEPDDELKDVDRIGLLIDVFFRGHLAKFMGLKNGLSKYYETYMKRYTVEKPEYENEEDTEVLFDTIFGNQINADE